MNGPAKKRYDFQGLSICVENPKGSFRYWQDGSEFGSTEMKFDYGFIEGTMGTDGDSVDVYVGPDKKSELVCVVTQMKKPIFDQVDEQKLMIGFSNPEAAKAAYLAHYDDPGFFGGMTVCSIDDLKDKLPRSTGKIIKSLYLSNKTGKLLSSKLMLSKSAISCSLHEGLDPSCNNCGDDMSDKSFKSDAQRKYMFAAAARGEVPDSVVREFAAKTPKGKNLPEHVKKSMNSTKEATDILKGLSAVTASALARGASRVRTTTSDDEQPKVLDTPFQAVMQPALVMNEFDPARVRTAPVMPQSSFSASPAEIYESCMSCGHMCAMGSECSNCAGLAKSFCAHTQINW